MRYELNQRETKNDLDVKCEFIRDEKIDYIVKLNFYKKALIHIMNQDNYKKVSLILQQLDIIYQSLLYDSDTEHLIYRKVLTLLEQDNLSEEEFGQISTLLYNIDEAYLYRSAYEKEYTNYLKDTLNEPKNVFKKYEIALERNMILNYLDTMMTRKLS